MNQPQTERRREFIINAAYWTLVVLIVFICFKYVAKWIMPFLVGFVIASMVQPMAKALTRLTHIPRKITGILSLIFAYALIVFGVWLLGEKIIGSIENVFANLPEYYDNSILPFIEYIMNQIDRLESQISPETLAQLYDVVENSMDSLRSNVIKLSSNVLSGIAGATAKLPFIFISFVFTILASVFISMDYKKIVTFVLKQCSPKIREFLSDTKKHIGKTALGYLRAYAIILLMTFTELTVGLSILRIENAVGIAALIAIADIFPVLGTGGIIIPWAIISLVSQNYYRALGLILLYAIITVVRNFTEPKIVGDQLGLNPLVTLIAIYLGYLMLGVLGMILCPITVNIIVGLQRSGKIKIWKD